jgi:hypothetical protein
MTEPNSQPEKPKDERRYDPELLKKGLRCDLDQYDFLKQCSEKGEEGIKEWNKWRATNKKDIYLEGANFAHQYLDGSFLDQNPVQKRHGKVHLRNAVFIDAKLRNVRFFRAYLENADFHHASLKGAYLQRARLEGADFSYSDLRGAQLPFSTVDGSTILFQCEISRHTWFYCVGLDSARIDPGTKQLLEYNIRRKNWEEWYKDHRILRWPAWWFWSLSDYGLRTWWIVAWFFGLAVVFAAIYYICGLIAPPGIVDYLFVDPSGVKVGAGLALIRAIHFSVVIMTVGFTNMHANAHSFWAHVLVGLQMILGFVLLGALVTRFAVLFTAGGPAGKFADDKEKESKNEEISQ